MITGSSDVPMAVRAMKAGALEFIEKPISRDELLIAIEHALEQARDHEKRHAWQENAAGLTRADGDAYIRKPYQFNDLLLALRIVHDIKTAGAAPDTRPPKNFHILSERTNGDPMSA